MCRLCGRVIKCIFDSMPSRIPSAAAAARARQFSTAVVVGRQGTGLSSQPPRFPHALVHRAKLHQAATVQQASSLSPPPPPPSPSFESSSSPASEAIITSTATTTATSATISPQSAPPPPSGPLILSKSLRALLPALSAQQPHYITAHIHRFPYLLTAGDTLRLPFHLHGVAPGDVLRFNRASVLGSRDYTLKAGLGSSHSESYDGKRREPRYVDERLFECRVRVMGVESQPMSIKEKTKRRNRKVKTVRSKHKYTVCRVMEVRVKSLDELMKEEKGVVVLE